MVGPGEEWPARGGAKAQWTWCNSGWYTDGFPSELVAGDFAWENRATNSIFCKDRRKCVVKLTLRDKETAQEAVRRFRKLVERSGIKKEMRVREFYEKPSEIRRRARLRAQRRSQRERKFGPQL
jgi:small subunit ribosomal protein S21